MDKDAVGDGAERYPSGWKTVLCRICTANWHVGNTGSAKAGGEELRDEFVDRDRQRTRAPGSEVGGDLTTWCLVNEAVDMYHTRIPQHCHGLRVPLER